jgi:hypothetical protein
MSQRILKVSYVSAYAINAGFNVFSPINHSWLFGTLDLVAEDWNIWRRVDFSFIDEWADEGWGLALDGYKTSIGWNDEKAEFKRQGKIWRCINYGQYKTQIDAIVQGLI